MFQRNISYVKLRELSWLRQVRVILGKKAAIKPTGMGTFT
jgi:hypothetical protein